jgi:lipopolysaccharide transport system ATP-binding protein
MSVVFRNVSKRFRTGRHHTSLRDLLGAWTSRPTGDARDDEFWALRDVTLDFAPGEALGIIGPNGAGKSTILKLLTGILRPTQGTIAVAGRIGALIELAAGFHPDLTGRENVYLQGAVMGMRRRDVQSHFDEIVAFADLAPFIDTPVKRYSSGMSAGVGFAIAAHLDPDLLLIDEVLAVGDRRFQERAMQHVRLTLSRGVPVVLVTHQLQYVTEFCTRAVLLARGVVRCSGTAAECVQAYLNGGEDVLVASAEPPPVQIDDLRVLPGDRIAAGDAVQVRLHVAATRPDAPRVAIALRVRALPGEELMFFTSTARAGLTLPASGSCRVEFSLRAHLAPGVYRIETCLVDHERWVEWARGPSAQISVQPSELFGGRVFLEPSVVIRDPA